MTRVQVLQLRRFAYTPDGTFGSMEVDGVKLFTVERPWLGNQRSVSCIPEGSYACRPRMFHRGGYEAVEITEVPDRSEILFHVANLPENVEGCIGVGSTLGVLDGKWAILSSRVAFDKFMATWGAIEFVLRIGGHGLLDLDPPR